MIFLRIALATVLFLIPAHGLAKGINSTMFVILVDDSGTIQPIKKNDPIAKWRTDYEALKQTLWSQLKSLRRSRAYKNAAISVIATSSGETVWTGTVKDLKDTMRQRGKAQALVDAAQYVENRCNDVRSAFLTLDRTLKLLDARTITNIHIYILSHLVHTGVPCSQAHQIDHPVPPPENLDMVGILTQKPSIKTVAFYGMQEDTANLWMKHNLKPLLEWEKKGKNRNFELYVDTATQAALMNGLEGVER